jgi:hypothetical protein
VIPQTLDPCHDLDLYHVRERELEKRAEVMRLLREAAPDRPRLPSRAMLAAGDALVSIGEWLKGHSHLAAPTARYAGHLQ